MLTTLRQRRPGQAPGPGQPAHAPAVPPDLVNPLGWQAAVIARSVDAADLLRELVARAEAATM